MPNKITSPRSSLLCWTRMPEAMRMVSPGSGTPMLSAITPNKTIKYPYWTIRERTCSRCDNVSPRLLGVLLRPRSTRVRAAVVPAHSFRRAGKQPDDQERRHRVRRRDVEHSELRARPLTAQAFDDPESPKGGQEHTDAELHRVLGHAAQRTVNDHPEKSHADDCSPGTRKRNPQPLGGGPKGYGDDCRL